ncbi:hypothetical protein [Brevundimonas fontaquae]|uniref:hypothetical protein n=1 Tax=Brevundimonas fontaquae TaxID=2813778 RepID=UPI00331431C6
MADALEDLEIQLLLEALFQRYHFDFRHYARASIKRRLVQARDQMGYACNETNWTCMRRP